MKKVLLTIFFIIIGTLIIWGSVFYRKDLKDGCIVTGCSSQICADKEVYTTCEFRPEYACYKNAACKRQANGKCGWTMTEELNNCLKSTK